MRRVIFAIFALVWLVLAGQPARAQTGVAQITGFRLSDSRDGGARTNFPSGAKVLYGIVDYANLGGNDLSVDVTDPSGVPLFSGSVSKSGTGTEVFEISASAVVKKSQDLITRQGPSARQMLDEALQASQKSIKVEKGATSVQFSVTLANTARSLSGLVSDAGQRDSLNQAFNRLDRVTALGREMTTTNLSDDQVTGHLQEMRSALDEGINLLSQSLTSLGDGSSLYFPDVQPGNTYVANSRLDGQLTESVEWTVGSAALTPTNTVQPPAAPTATRTPAPGEPTATPRPRATASPVVQASGQQAAAQATPTTRSATQPLATTTLRAQTNVVRTTATPLVSGAYPAVEETAPVPGVEGGATPEEAAAEESGVTAEEQLTAEAPTPAETNAATAVASNAKAPAAKVATSRPSQAAATGGLPIATVAAVGGACILGLLALWFRRKM